MAARRDLGVRRSRNLGVSYPPVPPPPSDDDLTTILILLLLDEL